MKSKGVIIVLFFVFIVLKTTAQSSDSTSYTLTVGDDILGMELRSEQEASQSIYSLTKGNQSVDEAAISSTLITHEEILMSGASNLLEVLRLSPDIFIRQSTNGNYTLHLRGSSRPDELLDNRNAVLLMINEIPYYNFLEQTVWWEAFPIALQDIESIEVVRFPHGAWYGPEASNGVINIVTKPDNGVGLRTQANAQGGLWANYAYQGSISFNQGGRFRAKVSGFYNQFSRFQDEYYIFNQRRYIPSDSLLFYQINARETNPVAKNALINSGFHFHADYHWSKNAEIRIGVGTQNSEAQGIHRKIYQVISTNQTALLNQIALTNRLANTNWFSLRTRWKSVNVYGSYQMGNLSYSGYDDYLWDKTEQWLGRVEYNKQWKKYRAGFGVETSSNSYQNTEADTVDQRVDLDSRLSPVLGPRYSINLHQQLNLFQNRFAITFANRGDYYSGAKLLLINHQLSTLVTLAPSHKLSAAISFGEQAPSVQDYPANNTLLENNAQPQAITAYEVKYRYQITKNIRSDITYFAYQPKSIDSTFWTNTSQYQRSGFTGKIDWEINRLLLSGFITKMQFKTAQHLLLSSTLPDVFGGVTGRYTAFFGKLRAFASVYYYSQHQFLNDGRVYPLSSKFNVSCKLSYQIWEEHSIFFSSQNLLNNRELEYPFGDQTRGMYWVGLNLKF
jgi:outer membrane receptor for Fe3+-dicitrate